MTLIPGNILLVMLLRTESRSAPSMSIRMLVGSMPVEQSCVSWVSQPCEFDRGPERAPLGWVVCEVVVRSTGEVRGRGLFKVEVKCEGDVGSRSKRSVSVALWSVSSMSWLSCDCDWWLLVVEVFSRLAVEVVLLGMISKTSILKPTESREKTGTPSGGRTSAAGMFERTR